MEIEVELGDSRNRGGSASGFRLYTCGPYGVDLLVGTANGYDRQPLFHIWIRGLLHISVYPGCPENHALANLVRAVKDAGESDSESTEEALQDFVFSVLGGNVMGMLEEILTKVHEDGKRVGQRELLGQLRSLLGL